MPIHIVAILVLLLQMDQFENNLQNLSLETIVKIRDFSPYNKNSGSLVKKLGCSLYN